VLSYPGEAEMKLSLPAFRVEGGEVVLTALDAQTAKEKAVKH
jgi:hypothetical protein